MGGNLTAAPEGKKAPNFLAAALKDPIGGNLDHIQIIKGWLDAKGELQEKVYDVAWSDDRKPDAETGKVPDEVPMIIRERAYTSPIWYTPKS